MISTPFALRSGSISFPSSEMPMPSFAMPKAFGMEGPVISASMMPVRKPSRLVPQARREVTVDFPTPPFPDTTPISFFTLLPGAGFDLGIPPCREGQLLPQELQSELQPEGFSCSLIFAPFLFSLHPYSPPRY